MWFKKKQKQEVKELDDIINYALKVEKDIRQKLNLDYALLVYEEIFYFSFLDTLLFADKKNSELLHTRIIDLIFRSFAKTQSLKYEENKDLVKYIYSRRMEHYAAIVKKNNLNIDTDFFDDIISYQAELLASIQIKKTFSDIEPYDTSGKNSCIFDLDHMKALKNVLVDNLKVSLEFLNK